jgi:hypothetical protein
MAMQNAELTTFTWKSYKLSLSAENGLLGTHYVDMYA